MTRKDLRAGHDNLHLNLHSPDGMCVHWCFCINFKCSWASKLALHSVLTNSFVMLQTVANMILHVHVSVSFSRLSLCDCVLVKPAREGAALFGRWGEVAHAGPEAAWGGKCSTFRAARQQQQGSIVNTHMHKWMHTIHTNRQQYINMLSLLPTSWLSIRKNRLRDWPCS